MNDLKNSKAAVSTKTINKNEFDKKTDNIYEAISIASKRAVQINSEIKKELLENWRSSLRIAIVLKKFLRTRNRSRCRNFTRNYQNHMPWPLRNG